MRTFLRRYQTIWFSVCFIFISLLIISFNKNGPQGISLFQRVVLEASAPIQWVITSSIRGIRSLFDHYIFHSDTSPPITSAATIGKEKRSLNIMLRLSLSFADETSRYSVVIACNSWMRSLRVRFSFLTFTRKM